MIRYSRWRTEGYMSSTGTCFDIGTATARALARFRDTGNPFAGSTDLERAGNGCVMRLAPVAMFFFPDEAAAITHASASSLTTHGAEECLEAAELLASILTRALGGHPKEEVLLGSRSIRPRSEGIAALARGAYLSKSAEDVRGSGYVVACLEAALWAFARSQNFRDALLLAANLGEDADTTAAVCGQVTGAYYGETGIPSSWVDRLAMRDEIAGLADALRTHR
jgi:ADP-ribosyl-[dinitrogen reductase] hydrolase